jgi:hypothetical protein
VLSSTLPFRVSSPAPPAASSMWVVVTAVMPAVIADTMLLLLLVRLTTVPRPSSLTRPW